MYIVCLNESVPPSPASSSGTPHSPKFMFLFFITHQSQSVLAICTWVLSHPLEATTLVTSSSARGEAW